MFTYLMRLKLSILAMSLLAGCSHFSEKIDLQYLSLSKQAPIYIKQSVDVSIHTLDKRRTRTVGHKKGDGNIELGGLTLREDLASLVTAALASELEKCNFCATNRGTTIEIEINRFQCDYKQTFLGWSCAAEMMMNVNIIHSNETILYTKSIIGFSDTPNVWFSNAKNAKCALESSLGDAICKIINDKAFLQALRKP